MLFNIRATNSNHLFSLSTHLRVLQCLTYNNQFLIKQFLIYYGVFHTHLQHIHLYRTEQVINILDA